MAAPSDGDRSRRPSTLERLVGDIDAFGVHWGRKPVLFRARGCVSDVFSIDDVDDLLARSTRMPTVRMVADGQVLPASQFCTPTRLGGRRLDDVVDPAKVSDRLRDGATLVLQSLHRVWPPVGRFVDELQEELSHPAQANAYLTPPAATGLVEHADVHDVLVLQVHGTKRWWADGVGDIDLTPGDVLYLPRGTRHSAATTDETSLHLTIGIIAVTRRQAIERVIRRASGVLDLPLPIGYRSPAGRDALEAALDEALDAALDAIGSADLDAAVEREQRRGLPEFSRPRAVCSFVDSCAVVAESQIRTPEHDVLSRALDEAEQGPSHRDGPLEFDARDAPQQRFRIVVGRKRLELPMATLGALRQLSTGGPVRVRELSGLDEPSCVVLARRLVSEGVCIVDPERR